MHIFMPNGGYCVYKPSITYFAQHAQCCKLENLVGNIQSRDAFRQIARERKYLVDHN